MILLVNYFIIYLYSYYYHSMLSWCFIYILVSNPYYDEYIYLMIIHSIFMSLYMSSHSISYSSVISVYLTLYHVGSSLLFILFLLYLSGYYIIHSYYLILIKLYHLVIVNILSSLLDTHIIRSLYYNHVYLISLLSLYVFILLYSILCLVYLSGYIINVNYYSIDAVIILIY